MRLPVSGLEVGFRAPDGNVYELTSNLPAK